LPACVATAPYPRRVGPAFRSFSDSIRSTRRMGRTCFPTVQPAACQREPRFAQSTADVSRVASRQSRCADHSAGAASWLPCQHYRCSTSCSCRANPVTRSCTAAVRRVLFRQGIAVIRYVPVPQDFPRPQVTHLHRGVSGFVSAPSIRCKGVCRRCRVVESVRCPASPHVLNAS
jgi:hypothetical protein